MIYIFACGHSPLCPTVAGQLTGAAFRRATEKDACPPAEPRHGEPTRRSVKAPCMCGYRLIVEGPQNPRRSTGRPFTSVTVEPLRPTPGPRVWSSRYERSRNSTGLPTRSIRVRAEPEPEYQPPVPEVVASLLLVARLHVSHPRKLVETSTPLPNVVVARTIGNTVMLFVIPQGLYTSMLTLIPKLLGAAPF